MKRHDVVSRQRTRILLARNVGGCLMPKENILWPLWIQVQVVLAVTKVGGIPLPLHYTMQLLHLRTVLD